jgi:phage anti-repressor protein
MAFLSTFKIKSLTDSFICPTRNLRYSGRCPKCRKLTRITIMMADLFIQFIREILMEVPGASIRWIFLRGEKTFKEILSEKSIYNYLLSFLFIGLIILLLLW